jgi:Ca2+-binding EF-hand superfamily protein
VAQVRDRIEQGFKRRQENFISDVFERYAESSTKLMPLDCFENAIRSMGVCLAAAEVKELFYAMDVDENQNLDVTEFKNAVEVILFLYLMGLMLMLVITIELLFLPLVP